jgi:ketosteroid isomerase-like protein
MSPQNVDAFRRVIEAVNERSADAGVLFDAEIEDLRDAGGDKVVAVLREQARGKASGLKVDRRSGWVATFRDGKVLSFEIHLDPPNALEAAGLRE